MGNTAFGAGVRQDQEFVFRCVTFEMPVRHPRSGMCPLGGQLGTKSEIQGVEGAPGWRRGFGDHQRQQLKPCVCGQVLFPEELIAFKWISGSN